MKYEYESCNKSINIFWYFFQRNIGLDSPFIINYRIIKINVKVIHTLARVCISFQFFVYSS